MTVSGGGVPVGPPQPDRVGGPYAGQQYQGGPYPGGPNIAVPQHYPGGPSYPPHGQSYPYMGGPGVGSQQMPTQGGPPKKPRSALWVILGVVVVAALVAGVLLVVGRGGKDAAGAPEVPRDSLGVATKDWAATDVPNPCDIPQSALDAAGFPNYKGTTTGRGTGIEMCVWNNYGEASTWLGMLVTTSSYTFKSWVKGGSEHVERSYTLPDGRPAVVTTADYMDDPRGTCSTTWATSYGHARIRVSKGHSATVGDMCQKMDHIFPIIYPHIRK